MKPLCLDTDGDFNRWPATSQSLHRESRWHATRLVRAVREVHASPPGQRLVGRTRHYGGDEQDRSPRRHPGHGRLNDRSTLPKTDAATFAVALDPSGKLHFQGAKLSGDHVIVLVGRDTPDSHLAELAADGVSYIVSAGTEFDIPSLLDLLAQEFAITHLVVEGGAKTNGAFPCRPGRRRVTGSGSSGARWSGANSRDRGLSQRPGRGREDAVQVSGGARHGVVQLAYAVLRPDA